MSEYRIRDEYIKLGQLLKAANLVSDGVQAKYVIVDGKVKVNGEVELQRGKKIRENDVVEYLGNKVTVKGPLE